MLPAFHFPASLERSRHRERLEASLAGLLELQFLRQRQEYLVREALQMAEAGDPPSPPLSADFTDSGFSAFPEPGASNSSLRRHLNGLRRQEIGFFSPLQQLERQVNDLRLEATQTSGGELETDSRPSSAEPLHLAREDSLSYADSDYVSSVPRSFSATHADSLEALMDSQPKYQCDLISRDGLDLFPYPSPLHAMAVQSPLLRQVLRASSEEKPLSPNSYLRSYNLEADGELFYDSQGELAQSPEAGPSKRLENYIAGLVHKRIYPVRSNKPRTSLSVEPAKGLMRQSSVCQRSMEASSPPSTLCEAAHPGPERRSISNSHSFDGSLPSPKYRSPWNSGREQALAKKSLSVCQPADSFLAARHQQRSPEEAQGAQQNPRKPVRLMANTPPMRPTSLEYHELSYHPAARGSPQESYYQNVYEPDDRPQAFLVARPGSAEAQRLGPEVRDKGSPLHSPEDGGYRMVNAQYIPAQQPYKAHASSQGSKAKGLLLSKGRSVELSPEAAFREKGKASGKKCRFSEEAEPAKRGGRKPSPRRKKTCRSQSENSLLNRPGVACIKYNTVERDEAMATRPHRSRRPPPSGSYRRWRSTAEISQEEAPAATPDPYSGAEGQRRARRYPKPPGAPGPAGSDSEYHEPGAGPGGAEEEEDEEGEMAVGAYAPNCFGDSESSLSEAESPGFSTCSSETDEEGGGLVWPQQVAPQAGGREAGQPKVFVKIKASHALKKKILRFRTGSLKVMTTV